MPENQDVIERISKNYLIMHKINFYYEPELVAIIYQNYMPNQNQEKLKKKDIKVRKNLIKYIIEKNKINIQKKQKIKIQRKL